MSVNSIRQHHAVVPYLLAVAIPGVFAQECTPANEGQGEGEQAVTAPIPVGVIPTNRACPDGVDPIVIHFDDEDDDNESSSSGYTGAIISRHNTDFFFCRVDGSELGPLVANSDQPETHYAVLKLGTTCPNGSVEFSRHFDSEDDNNENHIRGTAGGISPNVV
ncbi:MAG: hypothetical protein KC766_07980, partial [Myxococcales bacterium]|nr:hypothetical protein [Myxococcales bacterium]